MATLNTRIAVKQAASVARRTTLRNRQVAEFRAVFEELLALEVPAIREAIRRAEEAGDWSLLQDWIDEFYPEQEARAEIAMRPVLRGFGEEIARAAADEIDGSLDEVDIDEFTDAYLASFRVRWSRDSIAPVRAAARDLEGDELEEALNTEVDGWEEGRAQHVAEREATQAAGAYAMATYAANGVREMVWRANAGACELCSEMDGRTAAIEGAFLNEGDSVATGEERLVTRQLIRHPPLHGNRGRGGVCQCQIAAA